MASDPGSIAEKLNYLVDHIRRPDGKRWSNEQLAAAVRARGLRCSHTYIHQIRQGSADNPGIRHLSALAEHFGFTLAYFYEPAQDSDTAELRRLLHDAGVKRLAYRAQGLSGPSLQSLAEMVELARRAERLPERGEDGP